MKSKRVKKGFTLVEIMIVVVIIGLLAAMAIPAFKQVRLNSREKTVMNNLRQIAGAGAQYMLEQGVTQATYGDVVPTYVPTPKVVAGETYSSLTVTEGPGTLSVDVAGVGTVSFEY